VSPIGEGLTKTKGAIGFDPRARVQLDLERAVRPIPAELDYWACISGQLDGPREYGSSRRSVRVVLDAIVYSERRGGIFTLRVKPRCFVTIGFFLVWILFSFGFIFRLFIFFRL